MSITMAWALVLLTCSSASAAEPPSSFVLPVGDSLHDQRFTDHVQLLEDASGKLGIDEVASAALQERFIPATLHNANVGFTASAWWARFTLRNDAARERQIYLRQGYTLIDHLDLYESAGAETTGDRWRRRASGDRLPFATRDIAHRDLMFPLVIPAHGERTFYLRYESQGPIDVNLALFGANDLLGTVSSEQVSYGIYFGCVLMLLVWAVLVFIAVRDRTFLAYFAYVATFGLYMFVNNGLAFQFLWPDSPRWGNASVIVLLSLSLVTALQFSRMILQARNYTPRLDRVAQGLQLLGLLALAATPFVAYARLIVIVAALCLVSVIVMLMLGIANVLMGSRPAKYYLIAWGSFLAGSIVYVLKAFGVLPHTFFTDRSWQVGSLLEMILLSMTLSSRMNELQHQTRTDPLTLLGNRRLFADSLQTQFGLALQMQRPLSLLMLDIDRFKEYNDRHGHARGDEAIRAISHVLRKFVHKPQIACRYGGEEFAVILPGTDSASATALAEQVRRAAQEALDAEHKITVSIGVASLPELHFENAEQLVEAADLALYSAKEQGRNRVVVFQDKNAERASDPGRDAARDLQSIPAVE